MGLFSDKTLLITGGTGSFGNAVVSYFLRSDICEIRIFSRDEKKQDDMRRRLYEEHGGYSQKVSFFIGDVRDKSSLRDAMRGTDYVFHAAALKQVPSCEFFPMEAFKTNVLGTENVLNAAIEAQVKKVICLSTDKAAYPVNAMGLSKAMMEKVAVAKAKNAGNTMICCTRYGNILCSRGSVVPRWIEQIENEMSLTLTDPRMTRFLMTLEDAVELVLFAFEHGESGDIFVQKAPACTLQMLAEALCELFEYSTNNIDNIGPRHGEKYFETLLTDEEAAQTEDMGDFFRIPADSRDLYYIPDNCLTGLPIDFPKGLNSKNATLLTKEEVKKKLRESHYIVKKMIAHGIRVYD